MHSQARSPVTYSQSTLFPWGHFAWLWAKWKNSTGGSLLNVFLPCWLELCESGDHVCIVHCCLSKCTSCFSATRCIGCLSCSQASKEVMSAPVAGWPSQVPGGDLTQDKHGGESLEGFAALARVCLVLEPDRNCLQPPPPAAISRGPGGCEGGLSCWGFGFLSSTDLFFNYFLLIAGSLMPPFPVFQGCCACCYHFIFILKAQ